MLIEGKRKNSREFFPEIEGKCINSAKIGQSEKSSVSNF